MGDEDEHEMVDNPQRAWLVTAKSAVDPAVASLLSCLTAGQDALTGGAWTGPQATTWQQEFDGRRRDLRRGAQQVAGDLDNAIARAPRQVCRCQILVGSNPLGTSTSSPFLNAQGYPGLAPACSR